MKEYLFSFKDADYKIHTVDNIDKITDEIKKQRLIIEKYIEIYPDFKTAFKPLQISSDAPEIIKRMNKASILTGTGPMASVAGIIAEFAVQEALKNGSGEVIVENGGDIYLSCKKEIITGIYAGQNEIEANLALKINPGFMPVAVCSSSSFLGHSISFGKCDLATVLSKDAALADAAATKACNMVKSAKDIEKTMNTIIKIPGIESVIIVKNNNIGIIGNLPEIIRNRDSLLKSKITKHKSIIFK